MLHCHVEAKIKGVLAQDAAYLALIRPWTKTDLFPVSVKASESRDWMAVVEKALW